MDYLGELQGVVEELNQEFLFVQLVLQQISMSEAKLGLFLQPGSDAVADSEIRPEDDREGEYELSLILD